MKENRIYCIEVSGECQHLMNVNRPALAHLCGSTQGLYCTKNISWKPITKDACKNCKEGRYQGLTRKQTIEKMAKAMATVSNITYVNEEQWKVVENGFRISAEAVLNALLGGQNNDK